MPATLRQKQDAFYVRFRLNGKQHEKSLGPVTLEDASAIIGLANFTLHQLKLGLQEVPPDVPIADYVVSGGKCRPVDDSPPKAVFLGDLKREYAAEESRRLSESYLDSIRTHLKQLTEFLGKSEDKLDCSAITPQDIERFFDHRAKLSKTATLIRTRNSLQQFFNWCVKRGHLRRSPAAGLPPFKEDGDAQPFATLKQIEDAIKRAGLKGAEARARWKRLFLAPGEIADLLRLVQARTKDERSYLLHAIAAYTGMRRGEILRLRWEDIDFEHNCITARSRKASRSRKMTSRIIQMHPELHTILADWKKRAKTGPFVVGHRNSMRPLTVHEASRLFWSPMRGTTWCLDSKLNWFKVGFHTYRHSFVSNLAAKGVDQRVIDEFVGHSTEAMRRRYRHLFPQDRKAAIESFSLAANALASHPIRPQMPAEKMESA